MLKITTHTARVVVSLLIGGYALMALSLSAFSQEQVSTTTTEDFIEAATATNALPYTIEHLDDDIVRGDFVVGPGKVEATLQPGESKTVNLLVTNRMGEEKTFQFEIEDIKGTKGGDQAVVLLGNDYGPYTLKDYIHIPAMEFTLAHNDRATIPVTITLPADAEPGGRYGSVLVSTVSRDANLDATGSTAPSSAIVSRIGTLFFVKTPGSTDVQGRLVSFDTHNHKKFFTAGPIDFALTFENTGSVHLNPYGSLRITNMAGEEVGFVEVDPWFSLPKSLRTREIQWNKAPLFGRYTATAQINRGYDDIIDEQSVTFWVIPLRPLLGIFIGLFVFFLLLRFIITRFEVKRKQ